MRSSIICKQIQFYGGMMMKKIYLCLAALLLVSCSRTEEKDLKIVCPTGAPAIAFYKEASNANFETNSVPSNIVAMMNDNSDKDLVVIDTVSGLKAVKNGAPYRIAANITLGNFFIASTGNDEDRTMNPGDTIVLFGQNQTPDYLFHYLYGDIYDETVEFVGNVSDAAVCLSSGKNLLTSSSVDYVFIAQPALYSALNNPNAATYSKASVYLDVQEAYRERSGQSSLIQASVFVKNGADRNSVENYLNTLKENIADAIKTPSLVQDSLNSLSEEEALSRYGIKASVAVNVLAENNALGLGYVEASENKSAIDAFISLFGMEATDEEDYF